MDYILRMMGHVGVILVLMASSSVQALTDREINDMFNQALEQLEGEDPAKAIPILENILKDQPELNRVRLELALAHFRALNYAAARREAEQVLSDPTTPEGVKTTIRAFLDQVNNQDKRHVWTPYISLGFMHDDNVNVSAVSAGEVDIAPGITLTGFEAPRSDNALQIDAGLSHRYLSPSTFEFAGRDVAFAWQSSVQLFRNQYEDENDFHLMVVSGRTGPAWLAARKWRFQMPLQGDYISLGDETIAYYGGVLPSLTYFTGRISLTALLQVQARDFTRSVDQARDSLFLGGGFNLGYRSLEGRVNAGVGYLVFDEDADTERRSNDGQQFTGSFNFRPWANTNTFIQASFRDRGYHDVEPLFAVERNELEKRYLLGANYTFTDAGMLNNWIAEFTFRHTRNESNVPIFDFRRNQFLFRVYRSF